MDALEQLMLGPLSNFIERRKLLAQQARQNGNRALAEKITATKKPSTVAWAVNRFAHEQPKVMSKFFSESDRVKKGQQSLIRQGRANNTTESLSTLLRAQNEMFDDVTRRIETYVEESGARVTTTLQRKIRDTLRAAAFGSSAARTLVVEGRLERELEGVTGFEALGFDGFAATLEMLKSQPTQTSKVTTLRDVSHKGPQKKQNDNEAKKRSERERLALEHEQRRKQRAEAKATLEETQLHAKQARKHERALQDQVKHATHAAERAQKEALQAQTRAEETKKHLAVLSRKAHDASEDVKQCEREVTEAERALSKLD